MRDLAQVLEVDLRVDPGRVGVSMSEMIANLLQRQSLIDEVRRAGVAQREVDPIGWTKNRASLDGGAG